MSTVNTQKPSVVPAALAGPIKVPPFFPPDRHSSRHVTVEMPPLRSALTTSAFGDPSIDIGTGLASKTRDIIPNCYTPSKKVIAALKTQANIDVDPFSKNAPTTSNQAKLQTLKKDPYLAKLLAGSDNFKPETMLELSCCRKRQPVSTVNANASGSDVISAKKNVSVESLSTDGEDSSAKFLKADVKVLYKKLSNVELVNNDNDHSKNDNIRGWIKKYVETHCNRHTYSLSNYITIQLIVLSIYLLVYIINSFSEHC